MGILEWVDMKAGDLVICAFGRTLPTLGCNKELCIFLESYVDKFYGTGMVMVRLLRDDGTVFNVNEGYVRLIEN